VSALVVILLTPFLWHQEFARFMTAPLAAYFNSQHYSIFPLFPWMAYLLLGAAVASRYLEKTDAGREREFIRRTVWIGAGLVILAHVVSFFPLRQEYLLISWRASPLFFAVRFGCVLLLLTACWYFNAKRPIERSFVLDASRESLFVYAAHLVVIYSLSWRKMTLAKTYGESLGVMECLLASLALMALMVLGAKLWGGLKQRSATASRVVFYAFVGVLAVLFFVRK
jgi:uncharacterized membrane protein